jgi:hypothetical protein
MSIGRKMEATNSKSLNVDRGKCFVYISENVISFLKESYSRKVIEV